MKHISVLPRFALLLAALGALLSGCAIDLGQNSGFGNFGGKQPKPDPQPPFDVQSTVFGARWFPAYVRWAPDDSHLLVSLCHVNRATYCRIGKYWLAEGRWEVLNLQPRVTYRWPSYSPDGKHIVASVGGCDAQYICPDRRYALMLLSSDGARTMKLADTLAIRPTFSDDGKKLIYRHVYRGGGTDVFQFDLTSGKEEPLTRLIWEGQERGAPFFLPGGERFVFAGWMRILVPPEGDLQSGSRLDPRGGPHPNVIMYAANIRDGVVTPTNVKHLDLLWPGPGAAMAYPKDISRDGRVLYYCSNRSCVAPKIAAGSYKANEFTLDTNPSSKQYIMMLRSATEQALDTQAFVHVGNGVQQAAVSSDGLRVAFTEIPEFGGGHNRSGMGVISLGTPEPLLIEWPRFELDPAATQPMVAKGVRDI